MLRHYLHFSVLLILAFFCLPYFSYAGDPVPIDSVNYKRIQHKKIRKLISAQKQFGISTFDDIHPVCYQTADSNAYRIYKKTQLIRQDINVVWNNLTRQSLNAEFDGHIVTLGLLYSKSQKNIKYKNESDVSVEEGQILFFNLRVLRGLTNIAVALEVTRLDNDQKKVEYCYIDHGKTKGTQEFSLKPTPEGFTEITQTTRYSCKSRIRDRRLYSFFHDRIVMEFFDTIKNKSEGKKML